MHVEMLAEPSFETGEDIVIVVEPLGVQSGEPISDRLDNAPIYLLLNRLRASGLAWFFEDEILHITSTEAAVEHMTTIPYNLGDLLDADYDADSLMTVIESAIAPDSWATVGGDGVLNFLGDVMFMRQNGGKIPKMRRNGEFAALTDVEAKRIEAIYNEVFESE